LGVGQDLGHGSSAFLLGTGSAGPRGV
jgi:hypothetical protein